MLEKNSCLCTIPTSPHAWLSAPTSRLATARPLEHDIYHSQLVYGDEASVDQVELLGWWVKEDIESRPSIMQRCLLNTYSSVPPGKIFASILTSKVTNCAGFRPDDRLEELVSALTSHISRTYNEHWASLLGEKLEMDATLPTVNASPDLHNRVRRLEKNIKLEATHKLVQQAQIQQLQVQLRQLQVEKWELEEQNQRLLEPQDFLRELVKKHDTLCTICESLLEQIPQLQEHISIRWLPQQPA